MTTGATGSYLRGIICSDEAKEEVTNRVKNWPSPHCDIPVVSASELDAMAKEKKS